jgi:hypothetical protein
MSTDDDFDAAYAEHAASVADMRADVRDQLTLAHAELVRIRGAIGDLEEDECGSDCCGSSLDRRYALDFLESAERSIVAARGLMRVGGDPS